MLCAPFSFLKPSNTLFKKNVFFFGTKQSENSCRHYAPREKKWKIAVNGDFNITRLLSGE